MRYYPLSVDTKNQKLLVVGGGRVAYRKIQSLLKTDFQIKIIAKEFIDNFDLIKDHKNIEMIIGTVDENFFLKGYDFIIIATDNKDINNMLEDKARREEIPFLNSSDGQNSSFIMNKIIEEKGITISISADGKNPTLLNILANKIEGLLEEIDSKKIQELNEIRHMLKERGEKNIKETILCLYDKGIEEIKNFRESKFGNNNRF